MGAVLPASPAAAALGFQPLPAGFFATLAALVVCYLGLGEIGKRFFYRAARAPARPSPAPGHRHLRRRAARFSIAQRRRPALHRRPDPGEGAKVNLKE
ncbi:hypothetical protein ADL29_35945 [Streptomyces chattanoogensis]|uniref:Uncharacterized protein n=1 Tax=Streptomyces chattanoogensis TaxID=66876 RepID=A0A0N1JW98_9ACTN|nr:hypothetical protein ADL29_35945 [Streptomyces chattanoogensis]